MFGIKECRRTCSCIKSCLIDPVLCHVSEGEEMKKQKRTKPQPKKSRRRLLMICIAGVLVAVAATTVVSRHLANASQRENKSVAVAVGSKYRTVRVAGQDIQVDAQTGQIKPLSPQEAQRLAEGLKQMLNRSTDGLVEVQHADGSVSMNLDGRFQTVAVARVNEDGTLTESCIDSPEAAASFFRIDPKLLGVEAAPIRQVPAKQVIR